MHSPEGQRGSDATLPLGKVALIESVGGQRGYADWANPDHRPAKTAIAALPA